MMNKVQLVSEKEMQSIADTLLLDTKTFTAVIDGSSINCLQDYFDNIGEEFKFPRRTNSFDAYSDWMTDLSWLSNDGFVLIIQHYDHFLINDLRSREHIVENFNNIVLPWWQGDIVKFCVGGKPKPFCVYLVA